MDDTIKLIKCWLGNVKYKLRNSVNELLFNESRFKLIRETEPVFFNELKEKLAWLKTFIDDRDGVLHELKQVDIIRDSRGTCFDIKHPQGTFGTKETTKNILHFVHSIHKKIRSLDFFLMENMGYIYK